jgi:hypothetical protein
MDYKGMSTKHLHSFIRQYRKQLAHKERVASRHEPGTAYHTRAMRDTEALQGKIEKMQRELERRQA